jgi:hypothetical protein
MIGHFWLLLPITPRTICFNGALDLGQPTFVVSGYFQLPTLTHPPPLPGGQGSMASEEPAQPHPSPHHGVEGPQLASAGQVTSLHPCPPASPSGVVGRSGWWVGSQQFHSPPPHAPLRSVPTWADIARGKPCTQREAPTVSVAEISAIYQCCAAVGLKARFSIKNLAGFEEVSLICCFTNMAAQHPPPA